MNILVIYATNSGSTELVAKQIKKVLELNGHKIDLIQAKDVAPSTFIAKEYILIGTNSWLYEDKEGQPHQDIIKMLEKIKSTDLSNIKFACFGCGDRSYLYFCQGIDILSNTILSQHGTAIVDPLKIDSYYFDIEGNTKLVDDWTTQLINVLPNSN